MLRRRRRRKKKRQRGRKSFCRLERDFARQLARQEVVGRGGRERESASLLGTGLGQKSQPNPVPNKLALSLSSKWPCLALRRARHDAGEGAGEGWRVVVEEEAWPADEGEVG
jgi:hypothetical protein